MDLVPERLRNRIVTSLLMIAGFAVLFFLLQQLTFLLRFAPYERTTLWVPGALTFSALLVTPIWTWWRVYIGLCLAAYAAYYNDPHIPAPIALLTAQFHFVSVAAGVWALRRLTLDAPFASIGSMLVFVIAAGIMIPLATSIPSDGLRWLRGDPDFLAVGIRTFLCVALGMLIATPAITTAIVHGLDALRFGSGWRWIEGVSLAICLVSVGLWVFNTSSDSNAFPALIYAPVPFLLWAALRFEVAGAAWAILVIAYVSTWNAIHGRGPFVRHRRTPSSASDADAGDGRTATDGGGAQACIASSYSQRIQRFHRSRNQSAIRCYPQQRRRSRNAARGAHPAPR
jgi:integral membrane sensor domain MASE1